MMAATCWNESPSVAPSLAVKWILPPSSSILFPAVEDGFALLGRQGELVEVFFFILLEGLAVLRLHQRHAKHVDVIALARSVGIEHVRAGNIVIIVLA